MSPLTLAVWGASILVAVLAGPYGTYDTMVWPTRTLYWGLLISAGLGLGLVARGVMRAWLGTRSPLAFDLGAALGVSALLTPLIWLLRGALDPLTERGDLTMASIMMNTVVVVFGVFFLRRQTGAETPCGYFLPPDDPDTGRTRLQRRLTAAPEAEILRLSGRDHYVEVITDKGAETLRLRLIDAIDEMEPVKGLCVHRSHWVAQAAIIGVTRAANGKQFVVLSNGDHVPISRKYRPDVERLGLEELPLVRAV